MFRTRIVNHFIILLIGGLGLIAVASLPGIGLNQLIMGRSQARRSTEAPFETPPDSPPWWLSHGIPTVINAGLFFAAVYVIAIWFDVRTEIRVSQVNETVSVRQVHLMHNDDVKSAAFSEIADVRYSRYEDETVVIGSVTLILHDGRKIPVMESSVKNAKALQRELQRVLR